MALHEEVDPVQPVIAAVREGDRFAFAELVQREHRWVRGVVYGILGDPDRVDDVSQQVWASVWERAATLRDPKRWRPWLHRLARNAAIDAGRDATRRRERGQHAKDAATPRRAVGSPAGAIEGRERHQVVMNAIRSLPALYREPFVLRHLNGWGYRQIADVMGLPVDTVETRLVRARRFLRDMLQDEV